MKTNNQKNTHTSKEHTMPYKKLLLMAVLSFIAMYIFMYAMVDTFSNVVPNINQFYMAGLMTMPMLIIELIVMGSMYMNKKMNAMLMAACFIGLIVFFFCIRKQAAVSDRQFLRSMIPHHAAALLMAEEASIHDPEIKELARKIITSQQAEIEQMKAKLNELEK